MKKNHIAAAVVTEDFIVRLFLAYQLSKMAAWQSLHGARLDIPVYRVTDLPA